MLNKKIVGGFFAFSVLVSGLVHAGTTTITTKYEQSFKENKDHRVKLRVGHAFDNNTSVYFEQTRRWLDEMNGSPDIFENLLGLGYTHTLDGKNRWSIRPVMEYRYTPTAEFARPSLRLNYRVNDDWLIGARYRYEYQTYSEDGRTRSRVNRFDGYLNYSLTDQVSLGWNPNYAYHLGSGGSMYTGTSDRWENHFIADYRINRAQSLRLKYKRKDETRDSAIYNAGERNDVIELNYSYRF